MSGPGARDGKLQRFGPAWVMPLLALLLVLPLLLHGPSCGHDFGFHMQSWMDARSQMRQGTLLPRWAYSPAFNAGEPRFVFYPPASWFTGAVLLQLLPAAVVPASFTFLALLLAGLGAYALARQFAAPWQALLAAVLYLVNPYMLFTAWERTAYAELLAAAWLPWLFREALRTRPRVVGVAWPVALLWLTNAPAAVMGVYALVLMAFMRGLLAWRKARHWTAAFPLLRPCGGGLLLGMGLAGFYLVPAAYERRYVQIAMAIIPNMRVEDNFLFGHTGYGPHDVVLHTASVVSVSLLLLCAAALGMAYWKRPTSGSVGRETGTLTVLLVVAGVIAVLVWQVAVPVWHVLPELAFLQFPWRLMAPLACVFAAAAAVALRRIPVPVFAALAVAVLLAGIAGPAASSLFREGCEAHELPVERVALFEAHHGVGPTDEYTPGDSDNDQLRWDDPAWWLADNLNAPGPGTVPNPAATIVNYDEPPPLQQTVSGRAPTRLQVELASSRILVLNLRDYPAWTVRVNGGAAAHLQRDDGLLAIRLPPGRDEVDVHWRRLPDVWVGDALTLMSLAIAGFSGWRSRRIRVKE